MNLSLSEAFRPKSFEEVIGQEHLTGEKGFLRKIVEKGQPLSILLWGPPGCGKTTIARLYAKAFDPNFISLTGVTSGVAEIKKLLKEKENYPLFYNKKPLLFLDEIHRLNKAQQDLFLPLIENGNLTLIGATTENPSFAINDALLSRLRVFKLIPLGEENLSKMISCFEEKKKKAPFSPEVKEALIALSKGDGRHLFNLLENLQTAGEEIIDLPTLYSLVQKRPPT
ncbi:MAG: AAA family ATPase, partial [Simkania negevensis]|nr:AAA family ATPase [Simkania negevensis]